MGFKIRVWEPALSWLHELRQSDPQMLMQISEAIDILSEEGPTLGRPLVDRIKGSALPNLKELRPPSRGGTEVRVLFIFDPRSSAVILVCGDKTNNWQRWYDKAIKEAEAAYADYLEENP